MAPWRNWQTRLIQDQVRKGEGSIPSGATDRAKAAAVHK